MNGEYDEKGNESKKKRNLKNRKKGGKEKSHITTRLKKHTIWKNIKKRKSKGNNNES